MQVITSKRARSFSFIESFFFPVKPHLLAIFDTLLSSYIIIRKSNETKCLVIEIKCHKLTGLAIKRCHQNVSMTIYLSRQIYVIIVIKYEFSIYRRVFYSWLDCSFFYDLPFNLLYLSSLISRSFVYTVL